MKIRHEFSYDGTKWINEKGEIVKLPMAFRAKESESGRKVIIVPYKEKVRDHGASWEVISHFVYDDETLEKLEFSRYDFKLGYIYTWYDYEEV